MLSILLVGKEPQALAGLATEFLQKDGITVKRAASAKEAWMILGKTRVDVVVTAEQLADGAALSFVSELIRQYPLINCAMVSRLSPKAFHEATEGFGVFMQLPPDPGAEEAAKMVQYLESIDALMGM